MNFVHTELISFTPPPRRLARRRRTPTDRPPRIDLSARPHDPAARVPAHDPPPIAAVRSETAGAEHRVRTPHKIAADAIVASPHTRNHPGIDRYGSYEPASGALVATPPLLVLSRAVRRGEFSPRKCTLRTIPPMDPAV